MSTTITTPTASRRGRLIAALLLGAATLALQPAAGSAGLPEASWSPSVTERLVRLPSASIKKALDQDFSASPLAEALRANEGEIGYKLATLRDLQAAIDQAQGDIQVELKHQFLAEKKDYLRLMQEQQKMRGRHLQTRITVYQRLLDKISREANAKGPAETSLAQRQEEARTRLDRTSQMIDAKLFASSLTSNSKYAEAYARNVAAIEALVQKIEAHPHKEQLDVSGDAKNKPDFLRQLLAAAEGDMQVLHQEGEIVGLMAKLVALDALALQEEVNGGELPAAPETHRATVADAVELF